MHLPARGEDTLPHRLHDIGKQIRTDVRMPIRENAFRRAMSDKRFVHLRNRTALLRSRVQLPIRKRPRSPFPKTIIRILHDAAFLHDRLQIKTSRRSILSPLQHNRLPPELETTQRRQHPGRPTAHNHNLRSARSHRRIIRRRHHLLRQRPIHAYFKAQLHFDPPLPCNPPNACSTASRLLDRGSPPTSPRPQHATSPHPRNSPREESHQPSQCADRSLPPTYSRPNAPTRILPTGPMKQD